MYDKKVRLPAGADTVISVLNRCGYDAYAVGGCVRDSLLGLEPHDWDICTSAEPSEMISCLPGYRVIETGIKHGTVTVIMDDGQYEITTFRTDGTYSDCRHPDSVAFTGDLKEDLARRDFTINAMAYSERSGVVDPFDGLKDLNTGVIRCVGDADSRFGEDALRILRALRFSSVYGFQISRDTAEAVCRNKKLLHNIAPERIHEELCKLLCGKRVLDVLMDFRDVVTEIIPELAPCVGFDQNSRYHDYTVYDHTAHAVANDKGSDISVKLALLLHDIGKPLCYTEDEAGGHFYGHAAISRDIAEAVMDRLRFDNRTKYEVLELVQYHDVTIDPTPKAVKRWLNKIGKRRVEQLLHVFMADILAQSKETQAPRIDRCNDLANVLADVLQKEECFSLKELAINGADVISLGVPEGRIIGDTLRYLLDQVISGEIPNERNALKEAAAAYIAAYAGKRKG